MLNSRGFGDLRCSFVLRWDLRASIDKKERIDSFKRCPQRGRVCEISNEDVNAITEARARFLFFAHEDSRPVAALEQALDDFGPNVSRRTRNEISHFALLVRDRKSTRLNSSHT